MSYRSFNEAMRERFGTKVYKLTLDGGMSCPNRDGTLSRRGCLFCGERGSGEFAAPHCTDMAAQLELAKQRVQKKLKHGSYIAYFQSFTNTHAPLPYLDKLFRAAMAPEDIVALSIATRPDCLPSEVLHLLADLNRQKPVWVELGLQTIHPKTADYLRRGYPLSCFDAAVAHLKDAGIEVIVHMILGLPGETRDNMLDTARYIGHSGADGIKLQLLHVLEGTDLALDFHAGGFETLSFDSYVSLLMDCLRLLPPDLVIHRLTGDGPKQSLLAPLWSANKKQVLHDMNDMFMRTDLQQGSLWQPFRGEDKRRLI